MDKTSSSGFKAIDLAYPKQFLNGMTKAEINEHTNSGFVVFNIR